MYVFGIIAAYILIILIELAPFWKDKKKRQIIVYLAVMTVPLIISVCLVSGARLPNISSILTSIFSRK